MLMISLLWIIWAKKYNNLSTHFPKNSDEVHLIINLSKRKYITSNKDNTSFNITVAGEQIRPVTEFVYLDQNLSSSNGSSISFQHVIDLGRTSFEKN